jgi:hypothetical protein
MVGWWSVSWVQLALTRHPPFITNPSAFMRITMKNPMSTKLLVLLLVLSVCNYCFSYPRLPRFPVPKHAQPSSHPLTYTVGYFDQKISHFNFNKSSSTFKQKYLMDTKNWNKTSKGPILFYCGNEGPI